MKRTLIVAAMALLVIGATRARSAATFASAGRSTPVVTSVVPAEPARNTRPQALTVNGSDFQSGLTMTVRNPGGQSSVIRGKDIEQLRATSFQVRLLIDTKGTYSLVVTNPDGGASAPFGVDVK